jgi:hypothetical protein
MGYRFNAQEWETLTGTAALRCRRLDSEAIKLSDDASPKVAEGYLKIANEWLKLADEIEGAN